MRIPLRWGIMLGVALANGLVFGLGLAWMAPRVERDAAQLRDSYAALVEDQLRSHLSPKGELWAAGLLSWNGWGAFEDVLLVHLPELAQPGQERGQGLLLNPRGSRHRGVDFPLETILEALRRANRENRSLPIAGGLAAPVRTPGGRPWGGAWVVSQSGLGSSSWVSLILPWFLGTVVLLTGLTFVVTDRLLLRPLRRLSEASAHLARGEFSARVDDGGRADELGSLMRTFNSMAQEVQGFGSRLQSEVERATDAVRRAEAAATTQKRLAATGELAAGIAHEINNPLGGMLNAVEVLQRKDLGEAKRNQYLALVHQGLERIRHIAGGVLLLAPRSPRTGPVDLKATLEASLGLIRHRAQGQRVELRLQRGELRGNLGTVEATRVLTGLPAVQGQGDELGQCWLNLWVNSLDALRDAWPAGGGIMGLDIHTAPDEVVL
ncbi:MAG TPA: HAMP domain-containing protein, partial [Planctomycetota bacterium]|nr:HAMP domain-containing protein [Planctomycetota bacterium]